MVATFSRQNIKGKQIRRPTGLEPATSASDLKKSAQYRASAFGIEVRLRVEPDCAWLTIKRPGAEAHYVDIPDAEITDVVDRFLAIGDSPEKFEAFVNAAESVILGRGELA